MSDENVIDGPLGPFRIPMSVHPRTREVCEQISRQVFDGEYDAEDLQHVVFPRNLDVIDIGAGWGAFTVWAMWKWPGCRIWTYEPHEEAAIVLYQNVLSNAGFGDERRYGDVRFSRQAVTIDPAPKMNGCEDWGAYHVTAADDACGRPVAGIHPRDLPPCDILKVDTEGSEVDILENYPHLSSCTALLVEFHSFPLKVRVFEIAQAAGFRCVKEPPESASFGVTVWVRT